MKKIRSFLKIFFPNARLTRFVIILTDNTIKQNLTEQLDLFLGEETSKDVRIWHRKNMIRAFLRDGWKFNEYFYYHYWLLSKKGRNEFVREDEKNKFCDKMHLDDAYRVFYNKMEMHNKFPRFYNRDVFLVTSLENDMDGLRAFVEKHSKYIVKPVGGTTGKDIYLAEGLDFEPVKTILEKYKYGALMEELIVQAEPFKSVYPQAVNTLRVASLMVNGEPHIVGAAVRFGRGGAIIDNASQGGVAGSIDLETGIVTNVCDKRGHTFLFHPDTNVPLVGFRIPEWDAAKQMVFDLAKEVSTCRYVGWDLAYSDKGWVMVEGNSHGQMGVLQIPTQKGIRSRLLHLDPNCLTF